MRWACPVSRASFSGCVVSPIYLSNSPPSPRLRRGKPTLRRPYSLRPRVGHRPTFHPGKMPRGWSAKRRTSLSVAASSFEGCARLSALRRGVVTASGPRFLPGTVAPGVSELLAAGHSARGRSLGAARAPRDTLSRSPRAPHRPAVSRRSFEARRRISGACLIVAPSSRRLATTPSAEPGGAEHKRGSAGGDKFSRDCDYSPSEKSAAS